MSKDLIVYCPVLEFHSFFKCNLFLRELKKRYKDIRIICAIPEKAIGTISETDELIIASNEYMDKQGANLPEVLNVVTENGRELLSTRWFDTNKFIQKKYKNADDFKLVKYSEFNILDANNNIVFSKWFSKGSGLGHWRRDFGNLCSFVREGNFLKPEFDTFQNIKDKYGSMFNDKTYIIITRNFEKKQPSTNTLQVVPELKELIPFLLNNGIKIVNIGFPPQKLHDYHENYIELDDQLSQDDLMSLFYLSNGVILSGESGGFSTHSSTINDVFLISAEWSIKHLGSAYSIESARKDNIETGLKTYNLINNIKNRNYDEILKTFLNHRKSLKQEFSPNLEKRYIDQEENNNG
jgi:hypothetical protein